jgi:acyl-CoA thioesterase FadM
MTMDRSPFTFAHLLRVRWAELDPQGIVFNSLQFDLAVFRGPEVLTTGTTTYVNATLERRKPSPLPPEFVERVTAFERAPTFRK